MLNSLFSVQKILATSVKGIKVTSNGLIRSVFRSKDLGIASHVQVYLA